MNSNWDDHQNSQKIRNFKIESVNKATASKNVNLLIKVPWEKQISVLFKEYLKQKPALSI